MKSFFVLSTRRHHILLMSCFLTAFLFTTLQAFSLTYKIGYGLQISGPATAYPGIGNYVTANFIGNSQSVTCTLSPSCQFTTQSSNSWVWTNPKSGTLTITLKTSKESVSKVISISSSSSSISFNTYINANTITKALSVGESCSLSSLLSSNATTIYLYNHVASVLDVSSSGTITALQAGYGQVTAYANDGSGAKASIVFNVSGSGGGGGGGGGTVSPTGVSLNYSSLSMTVGATRQLTATVTPSNATDKSLTWSSSNTSVVSVNQSGTLTAKATGNATITVRTSNGKTASCSVTVSSGGGSIIYPTGVSLNYTSLSLDVGDTRQLSATVSPSNATDQSVTWSSSNSSVVSVSQSGTLTAEATGYAKITVKTCNDKTASCGVTVSSGGSSTIYPTGVSLNYSSLSMTVGDTRQLSATVTPSNATNKSVTWSSSNSSVVSVNQSGTLSALSPGNATITVETSNGMTASCSVTVSAIYPTGVSLNYSSLSLDVGDTRQLSATVTPSNATDKSVTWSSNNSSIASVDATGMVTAKQVGTARISATSSNGKVGYCDVTCKEVYVSSIIFKPSTVALNEGESLQLSAMVQPNNATDKSITWRSENTAIATVDAIGKITAQKVGVTRISATSSNGIVGYCYVACYKRDENEFVFPQEMIWYTSIDDSIVAPYDAKVFGSNILSNSYENGQGIIIFSKNVTSIGDSAFNDCTSLASIIIPNSVTSIGAEAFLHCSSLTSVNIPNSVKNIGGQAFNSCSSLATVNIPSSITRIEDWTFAGCSNLTAISIPNTVTSIGMGAFGVCTKLASISIPNTVTRIEPYTFNCCNGLTSITIPNSVTSIGSNAFYGCENLVSIKLPDSLKNIEDRAFLMCSSLESITIPNSVTSIVERVFGRCTSLTSITIPNSVTSIGEGAFEYCSSLTSISIPNSVTSIESSAFWECSSLTSINIETGNSIYDSRNNCNAIIKTSENSLYIGCKNTIIPNSVTSIGGGAFQYCSSLTSITIPNSVTSIGNYAFYCCSSLASITIPNLVMSIGSYAFSNCSSLTSITIPNSVTSINSHAFSNCSNLKDVYINWKKPANSSCSYDIFSDIDMSKMVLHVPEGTQKTYENHWFWMKFGTIIDDFIITLIQEGEIYTISTCCKGAIVWDGTSTNLEGTQVLGISLNPSNCNHQFTFIKKKGTADQFYMVNIGADKFVSSNENETTLVTNSPKPWTIIGSGGGYPFMIKTETESHLEMNDVGSLLICTREGIVENSSFKFVYVGNISTNYALELANRINSKDEMMVITYTSTDGKVVTPNASKFPGAKIESNIYEDGKGIIKFNGNVTSIGESAFDNCSNLASITLPNSVTSIGSYAFRYCSNLTEITLPNLITKIESYTFYCCSSLISVIIPKSVQSIGDGAFFGCSKLRSITLPSSITSLGERVFGSSGACSLSIHCCAENVPNVASNTFVCNRYISYNLFVPSSAISKYESIKPWNQIGPILERISSVEDIKETRFYTISTSSEKFMNVDSESSKVITTRTPSSGYNDHYFVFIKKEGTINQFH